MKSHKKTLVKTCLKTILVWIIIFILSLLFFSMRWFREQFQAVEFATALYQIVSPLRGAGGDIVGDYLSRALTSALFASAMIAVLYGIMFFFFSHYSVKLNIDTSLFHHKKQWHFQKSIRVFLTFLLLWVPVVLLVLLVALKANEIGIFAYLQSVMQKSSIYEDYYVSPADVKITFPEEKRNLLLIYVESMENTYASRDEGGERDNNLIPNLTRLAKENVSFSNTGKLGGAATCNGSDWTMGAILTSTSGANFKLPLDDRNKAGTHIYFLPGLVAMGDVLENEGYKNYFICGTRGHFAGRSDYFEQHGSYIVEDRAVIRESIIVEDEELNDWGLNDNRLYEYLKPRLTEIAKEGQPFNVTTLTVDTHFPKGYICELCESKYSRQYANVLECADRQLMDFIDWVQDQEWYENTSVVLIGDHLCMGGEYFDDVDPNFDRRVYNCFMNSSVQPVNEKNREFTVIDYFPTILASMGATVEGEQLGLGVNLFSDKKTLEEEMGIEQFNEQLGMYSSFYFNELIMD